MDITVPGAMARMAKEGPRSHWQIRFFSQLQMTRRFAARQQTECRVLRCPPSHRVLVECLRTNKSMHSYEESDPGRGPVLSAIRLRHPIQRRILAIRNMVPMPIGRTAPPAMGWTVAERARPARS